MSDGWLKLTAYLGERDRQDGTAVSDALIGLYARHELHTSILLRGTTGFGARHAMRTDRLLSLSEDLPLVSIAVDRAPRVEAVVAELDALRFSGLVTLEAARMLPAATPPGPGEEAKLTVYLGRQQRTTDGARADRAVVDLLHARGVAGATVLLGVDGTVRGERRRAGFFSRNADVPLMVLAVGDAAAVAAAAAELGARLARPLMTLERVQVCKRDGALLATPAAPAGARQKLTVYAGEQARHAGRPLTTELVARLRRAGAPGATTVRGVWGYHGDHRPHGDIAWQLRRRVPLVTVVIDEAERMPAWWTIVDELTDTTGLVTSEVVPAAWPAPLSAVRPSPSAPPAA